MSVSPHDLLELARAASTGEHVACNLWCKRCKAARKLRAAATPARIAALCERLEAVEDVLVRVENPGGQLSRWAMATSLDAQPEIKQ